jgi:protease-4
MRRFIVGLLATVGTLTLIVIGGIAAFIASGPFSSKPLPQSMVLSIDLRNVPPESTSTNLLRGGLFGGSRGIVDAVQLLWQAADDPRVVGLFVDIGDESAGLARVQELRQAIAHFRGKGKFAIGFAESLGSGGTHLASPAPPIRPTPPPPTSPTTISPLRWSRSGCSRAAVSRWPASPSRRRS